MGDGTKGYVHDKHFALTKKMVTMGELELQHEMSVVLQTTKTVYEFNDIVDKYWGIILAIEKEAANE